MGGRQRNCIFRTIYQQFACSYFSICAVTMRLTFKSQKQAGSRQTGHKRHVTNNIFIVVTNWMPERKFRFDHLYVKPTFKLGVMSLCLKVIPPKSLVLSAEWLQINPGEKNKSLNNRSSKLDSAA